MSDLKPRCDPLLSPVESKDVAMGVWMEGADERRLRFTEFLRAKLDQILLMAGEMTPRGPQVIRANPSSLLRQLAQSS